jgi:hypothetical protein
LSAGQNDDTGREHRVFVIDAEWPTGTQTDVIEFTDLPDDARRPKSMTLAPFPLHGPETSPTIPTHPMNFHVWLSSRNLILLHSFSSLSISIVVESIGFCSRSRCSFSMYIRQYLEGKICVTLAF